MAAILVLDIGKSNAKLLLLDEAGATLATRTRPSQVRPGPPYPHLDLDGIWDWLVATVPELAALAPIGTVVPVAHGAAAVLIAGEAPALPAIDYEFAGPDETAAELVRELDPFALTGSPALPLGLNVGAQLYWQERRFPEAFARATDLLMLPQYWAWRLSGIKASEVTSLGAHSHLWRPVKGGPTDFARRKGWDRLVPPRRRAWEALGPAVPELGLEEARVLTGIHDSNCSYLAHVVARPAPFTVVSTGTWVIVMAAGVPVERLRPELDMLCNVDALGHPAPTTRFMGGREVELLAGGADGLRTPATPDDVAALVTAGVMALPSFAVGSGPYMGRKGEIRGEPSNAPGRRAALAALYAALTVDVMLENLGAEAGPVLIEGSFHRNAAFAGLLAALRRDQPVHAIADASGTTKGAWLLARWGEPDPMAAEPLPPAVSPWDLPRLDAYRASWREAAARPGP